MSHRLTSSGPTLPPPDPPLAESGGTQPCSCGEEKIDVEPTSNLKDIEHVPVPDDPRAWGYARKTLTLAIVSSASMLAGYAATGQNPANTQIGLSLHASSSEISWSMSVFIIVQGLFPLVWSAVSEIKGRKAVYLLSMVLFTIGSAVVATSKSIGLVVGMRALQAAGSSAVMAIAAATLADIYEPDERGTKMGIYYAAPLLGTSLGPFLGGSLAQAFGWRAVFYCALVSGGIVLVFLLVCFKDSFRKERSLSYQNALRRRSEEHRLSATAARSGGSVDAVKSIADKLALEEVPSQKTIECRLEAGMKTVPNDLHLKDMTLSLTDVNPFPPIILVLKRWNNNAVLFASGLIFAFTYSLTYSCARTLSIWYGYNALDTGLVLLSYGTGTICGSILGGRWSDRTFTKLKIECDRNMHPEMRLQSTLVALPWLPLSALGYAWVCQTHQPIAAICVMLFIAGFSSMWVYTSTLVYIADANVGRCSTAVAANSAYRGTLAFIAAEIAIPLQDSIGDGGLYTFWAGLLTIMGTLILLVLKYGQRWRERCEEAERNNPDCIG